MDDATNTSESDALEAIAPPDEDATALPEGRRFRIRLFGGIALLLFAATAVGLATGIWEIDYRSAYYASFSASCQNNLKQMGLVFKMYANESLGEKFPPLSSEAGQLMFVKDSVVPEYLTDEEILVCPGPVRAIPDELIDDLFYVYTGYVLQSDEDVLLFAEAYAAQMATGGSFDDDLAVGDTPIHRIREGIERFYITDINNPAGSAIAQSEIPVMWDWPDNHQQGWGGNVLYMDGHVKWQKYPGEFPMTEVAFTTLANLAGYSPPDAWEQGDSPAGHSQLAAVCQLKFKQLGVMHKMFANESFGAKFPQLSSEAGKLLFDTQEVYPVYIQNRDFLRCPGRADTPPLPRFDDDHFIYWGYFLTNDEDVQAFAGAYPAHLADGGDFSDDLNVPSSYGDSIRRLREGIERFLITDINSPRLPIQAQSKTPIMMEWPDNHEGQSGGNVLFLDGHVEWMAYPGEFPMTEVTVNAFRAIAQPAAPTIFAQTEPAYSPENDPYDYVSDCLSNVQSLRLVNQRFSNRLNGYYYPPLSARNGKLMFDETGVYPEHMRNRTLAVCPGPVFTASDSVVNDQHYAYLGYVVLNDSDVQQFAAAYAERLTAGGDFAANLPGPSSYGNEFWRLRPSYLLNFTWPSDTPLDEIPVPGDVPVFIEWPGNHEGLSGGHVLYLDGTTRWQDYPGEFPMTEATIGTLATLAHRTPATAWNSRTFTAAVDPFNQALCQRNLTTIGIAFRTYKQISTGYYFPQLGTQAYNLAFNEDRFVQFHLFDLRRMNCPGSPSAYRQPVADDHSYAYLGYMVHDQETLETFAVGYGEAVSGTADFSDDLTVGGDTVPRIRDGVDRFFMTDAANPPENYVGQHEIPLLIEWPDNHGDIRGGNVLYMDGHVEWLDYPGEFPMTEEAMAILTDLAGREPIRDPSPPRERSRLDALILQRGN